jgi:acyl carrier protein
MEIDKISQDIYTYIKNEINHSNDFDMSTHIIEEGMVDSIGIVTLVAFLEEKYGIEIDFEYITPEKFSNVGEISRFIKYLVG